MTEQHDSGTGRSCEAGRRPPEYVVVAWVSEQLRDRAQHTGMSLTEALRAGSTQPREPDADLEAEP